MEPELISAYTGYHMDEIKDRIYDTLGFMRGGRKARQP